MLADAHCHLQFEAFQQDREAVIARARACGVSRLIVAGTRVDEIEALAALQKRHGVEVCLGLHPWFLDEHGEDALQRLERALQAQAVVALGECGVDALVENVERQWQLFDAQLKIAQRLNLPVVIHCVKYYDEVGKRLKALSLPARGLIHGFTGSEQQAQRLIELGYVLGIGGAVTFDRAQKLKRTVARLPADGFVLESDAPDMTPQGRVPARNEPAHVALIAREVARLRDTDVETLARETSTTLARLFPCRNRLSD